MPENILAMSDEEFLKQPVPEMVPASSVAPENTDTAAPENNPSEDDTNAQVPAEPAEEADTAPSDEPQEPAEKPAEGGKAAPEADAPAPDGEKPAGSEGQQPKGEEKPAPAGSEQKQPETEGKPPADPKGTAVAELPDQAGLTEFYKAITAPFNANGKQMNVQNAQEAIQLMQMGANYTRKMQELAPRRKILTMLENNSLLDEDRLSYLIDLDKKDPEAIKRLIKESGLDPLDIDTNVEPAYQGGSHKVSDHEVAFRSQLEDVQSQTGGPETLQAINAWDQASKDMLWQQPDVMTIIHQQRAAGIYDQITAEMDRQKALGQIGPSVPFLDAYRAIGDKLYDAGLLIGSKKAEEPAPAPAAPAEPLAVRTATPKPDDASAKAAAAAQTRVAPKTAEPVVNFLAMSDEDFLKSEHFKGRV